jgi:hypothetical protein
MNGFSAFTHWVRLKIPFTPFDKLMTGFDKLRANGISIAQLPFLGLS